MSRNLTIILAAISGMTCVVQAEPLETGLWVSVYNKADVPDYVVSQARKVTERIYRAAGVTLRWFDSSFEKAPPGVEPVYVKLLAASAEKGLRQTEDANRFGFALLTGDGQPGSYAYIFYDRIGVLANRHGAGTHQLLGQVMAHEIGHLLLGTNSHTGRGIMKANWHGRQTVNEINMELLRFSTEEEEKIRLGAHKRARIETATTGELEARRLVN